MNICPHCNHPWVKHTGIPPYNRCDCGCMWTEPKPPPPPPTPEQQLRDTVATALWASFEECESCHADAEMDCIDTSGEAFSMTEIAQLLIENLIQRGINLSEEDA